MTETLEYKIKSDQQYYEFEKSPEVQKTKQIEAKCWGACGIVTAVCLASFGICYLSIQNGGFSWPASLSVIALSTMGLGISSILFKANKTS